MNSKYPWKLLVVMHHGSMVKIKDTTEAYITWYDQAFLIVIHIQKNGVVQQRHQQKSMYAKSTVYYTIHHLILHGMIKIPVYMNSEPLDVIYTPSPHLLKS